MRKRLIFFFLFIASACNSLYAQLQSPEQFLGYPIGSRYTPHWRIVEYYKHVAASVPSMVKLQQYGVTNEGRPLMVAYVSNANNLSNLENIKANNIKLSGSGTGKGVIDANTPAVVWLSYNVHGNETSSSEAGMLTIYSLVDPANAQTKEWLKNTMVIIDPCLNPDGRDRYVNWFNSVVGKSLNPNPEAREHQEPWPGGRSNHYNFDLNRDWAWQTQIESQQRLALYNQWLPQIHVDFHEQGINNPYYFAPAAQPFHEVITPFQRSFQEIIGRNHARYFDEKGWLYFTKERFDLLYPSYGDTYPIYAGAIGMTYEQAGGGRSGAAIEIASGDTLTLRDRAMHHFTTSLSTLEVASKNSNKLLTEYQKFYSNAANGIGEYKSYVIKNTPQDAERVYALTELLKKNGIQYYAAKGGNAKGFNYDNGKDESFFIAAKDIVIPAAQPKSTLLKVLFEPKSVLVDSATYDITAWSMPYVYGVKAYALKDKIETAGAAAEAIKANNVAADVYGYVIRWSGVQSVKLVSQLLQKGIKLRYSEQPFTTGNQSFERGAVIVLKTGNNYYNHLWDSVRVLANKYNVQLTPVSTGFVDKGYDFGSSNVVPMKARKVALVTGEGTSSLGAGEIWHFMEQVIDYPVTLVNANDLGNINWGNYNVVILPDGNYRFFNDKANAEKFHNWVLAGGNVIAMEGAVAQLSKLDWTIKSKKNDEDSSKDAYDVLKKYENRERDEIPNLTAGSIYKVALDNTHPLAFGFPNYYYTLKQDDQIYEFIKNDGWNVGVIKKDKPVAGFVGTKLARRLQDGLLFGAQSVGRGNITYLVDDVLFRSFWENGKLMFSNALFLVGQ